MGRILIVGLDEPEYRELKTRIDDDIVYHDMLPRVQIKKGELLAELPNMFGRFVTVDRVVFHGIFENDLPLITALALWGGPCLPNAVGMMNCRQRIPCLVRSLQVTRFASMKRSLLFPDTRTELGEDSVAKWGEWHCGEGKEKVVGSFTASETSLIEPYIRGSAVRVHILGKQTWQIRMGGDDWKKSIHHNTASLMEVDPELLADSQALQEHFGLEMLAVDYMIGDDGRKHMLEVNHIPNVTQFSELRAAYLDFVTDWCVNKQF